MALAEVSWNQTALSRGGLNAHHSLIATSPGRTVPLHYSPAWYKSSLLLVMLASSSVTHILMLPRLMPHHAPAKTAMVRVGLYTFEC